MWSQGSVPEESKDRRREVREQKTVQGRVSRIIMFAVVQGENR